MSRRFFLVIAFSLLACLPAALAAEKKNNNDQRGIAFFERKIRPLLIKHCYECHSAKSEEVGGGLLLDTRQGIRKGGDSGHAVVPGNVKASLLVDALKFDILEMPPDNQLSEEVVAVFVKWIRMGAPDPRNGKLVEKSDEPHSLWSLKPISDSKVPQVNNAAWPKNDIDRFILARLEKEGIKPVGDADPVQLLRRVYLDLIGLPPAPEAIDAFQQDSSPQAFAEVVDSLLNSPRFGERWGRHWLDVVRYAESNGKDRDVLFPNAWRYRDYVIHSFNDNKPYDRFLSEQLAGDLLDPLSGQSPQELQIATGFLALTSKSFGGGETFFMNIVDDQIDVTSRAMMGLTVACARCHDHKFDPIPSIDYYALAGIFRSTETRCGGGPGGKVKGDDGTNNMLLLAENSPEQLAQYGKHQQKINQLDKQVKQQKKNIKRLQSQLSNRGKKKPVARAKKKNKAKSQSKAAQKKTLPAANQEQTDQKRTEQAAKLKKQIAAANASLKDLTRQLNQLRRKKLPPLKLAMGVREGKRIADLNVLIRGEVGKKGDPAPRGFLTALDGTKTYPIDSKQSGRRQLAQWITDPANPYTARVAVNRLWHHLLGRGLVRTVDNFGTQGEAPSHPELLDFLAHNFIEQGWSVKKTIRQIVLSHTYQLSTRFDESAFGADADNNYRWRMNPRRLEVEVIRDSLLSASGNLDLSPPPNGSPVAEIGTGEVGRGINEKPLQATFNHRSVYLPILRTAVSEVLRTFDFAEPSIVVGDRAETTIPAQALYFMNSPFVITQAQGLARRLLADKTISSGQRITQAYMLCLARAPSDSEQQKSQQFLTDFSAFLESEKMDPSQVELAAWTALGQALFSTAEFRYVN